jgi:phosphatidate cytidylyltransferase
MPTVSPKKTREGALGGLVGSLITALSIGLVLDQTSLIWWSVIGLCVGIVGQMGDLFESLLKRVAHVKDSGSIMPGHGGVLDRIDGVLFASPFLFLICKILQKSI